MRCLDLYEHCWSSCKKDIKHGALYNILKVVIRSVDIYLSGYSPFQHGACSAASRQFRELGQLHSHRSLTLVALSRTLSE